MEFQSSLELSPECNLPTFEVKRPGKAVSILTRAFARVQRRIRIPGEEISPRFNPHSSFRPSATGKGRAEFFLSESFNPHSSFRPSATWCATTQAGVNPSTFQSSLELSPECNLPGGGEHARGGYPFQSSLELSPECNAEEAHEGVAAFARFNPHSSFRPSATRCHPSFWDM